LTNSGTGDLRVAVEVPLNHEAQVEAATSIFGSRGAQTAAQFRIV
jgi:hypothetical protein